MSEKSHVTAVTRTREKRIETSTGQKTQYFVGVCNEGQTDRGKNDLELNLSSSLGGVTIQTLNC